MALHPIYIASWASIVDDVMKDPDRDQYLSADLIPHIEVVRDYIVQALGEDQCQGLGEWDGDEEDG